MSAPRRPSRSVDEIIHDWNLNQFGPETETFPPQRLHDEYGRCWPHQHKNIDVGRIDDIIARYVRENAPLAADWFRRLKTYGGDRRLMLETERRDPVPPAPPSAGDPVSSQTPASRTTRPPRTRRESPE